VAWATISFYYRDCRCVREGPQNAGEESVEEVYSAVSGFPTAVATCHDSLDSAHQAAHSSSSQAFIRSSSNINAAPSHSLT
jgi:hypothetical protein